MSFTTELAPASLALADDGGDLKVSAIPHAAVADLCVDVLGYPNAARATLCATRVKASYRPAWPVAMAISPRATLCASAT